MIYIANNIVNNMGCKECRRENETYCDHVYTAARISQSQKKYAVDAADRYIYDCGDRRDPL